MEEQVASRAGAVVSFASPLMRATQVKTKKLPQLQASMRTPATNKRLRRMNPPARKTASKVSPPTKRMRTDAAAVSGRSDNADLLPMMNTAAEALEVKEKDATSAQVRNISKNLRGIVNRMKLHLSRPSIVPEPTTPAVHLQVDQAAGQPGIPVDKQFLSFLLTANREQLLGIKCIGKKRADYIILLRKTSPEQFENMKDFVNAIGFHKIEKQKMMASFVRSPLRM